MRNHQRPALAIVLLLAVVAWSMALAGCQQAPAGATKQPSLATLTTQTEAAVDAAVSGITLGRQLNLIPDAEFASYVAPAVLTARAATKAMEASVQSGDQSGWQTAQAAATAALTQLQPVLARVQTAQTKAK